METVNSHNILGIIVDKNLNFNEHVKHLAGKCKKQINILNAFTYKRNGGHPKTLCNVLNATVKSKILYGYILYSL